MTYSMELPIWRELMKIEIAEPGRMTQTGSSLLKLIQNNNMPVLDLLVRESIQNSLDARMPNSKYVEMNYLTGTFDSFRLSMELEGITKPLRARFPQEQYDFIAARDSHTVGLTGELDYKKVKNNDYGNLLKLIYEICKPQEAEGAGGSWGLGKTVYFRIGIGLVIYYSRIKTNYGFSSRLAASYVENESAPNAMIPVYKDQAKRGIAWWGESIGENITQPITDEEYINDFLRIFSIEPYSNDETGTTIIIPYINKELLLTNNQIEYLNSKEEIIVPYWCHDIEDYLAIASQRWYAPRLNNIHYTDGAYLRLKINGNGLAFDKTEPAFKVIQALYNRANNVVEEDILSDDDTVVKADGIKVLKYLSDTKVGMVSYAKVPRRVLGMDAPTNKPEPYMYFNCEVRDDDFNKPTVCFTRSPAMIVAYENVGPWASNITSTSKNEYIIAIFVLNSWNQLKNSPISMSLEEYIRKSEMADHTSWSDWSEGTYNPRIVTKIQNGVNKLIGREFAPVDESPKPKVNSGLGKLFGDLLLPPDGFGKQPNTPPGSRPAKQSKKRGIVFRVDSENVRYSQGEMSIPIVLESTGKKRISSASFEIQIDSESKRMSIDEWEIKLGISAPFFIKRSKCEFRMVEGKKVNETAVLSGSVKEIEFLDFSIKSIVSKNGTCYGISINSDEPHSVKAQINVILAICRNDIKPAFIFEKEASNV